MSRAVVVLSGGQDSTTCLAYAKTHYDEVWVEAAGWPEYEVSTFGRVRRARGGQGAVAGRVLKIDDGAVGFTVNAKRKQISVAALMLRTFVGEPPDGKPLARHLDDNRSNNVIENLAWGDHADNRADAVRNGTMGPGLWNLSSETRDKMRNAHLGLANTPEQNERISLGQSRAWARRKGSSK